MPFVFSVGAAGVNYATNVSANTEDAWMAVRQGSNRGFNVNAIFVVGKGSALTTLTGIGHHVRRWTTAGSGGTALTPAPRRLAVTASSTAADKQTALTPGTVSGAVQLSIGHGAAGPGGWVARDEDSKIHVEGGSADEVTFYSITGGTSLNFSGSCEIEE